MFTEAQQPLTTVCSGSNDNCTTDSTYRANLDVLLGSLSTTTNTTGGGGFSTNITREVPNCVFGLALCRGDAKPAVCGSCEEMAAANILKGCPYRRSAAVWYDDCCPRYSDQLFFTTMGSGLRLYLSNPNNITLGASQFKSSVWAALLRLAHYAAYNDSARPPRFAAGEMVLGEDVEFPKIYGLAQCSRDISDDDCSSCLKGIIGSLPKCCLGKRGGGVLADSCNLRYEYIRFSIGWLLSPFLHCLQRHHRRCRPLNRPFQFRKVTTPAAPTSPTAQISRMQEISTESLFFNLSTINMLQTTFLQQTNLIKLALR